MCVESSVIATLLKSHAEYRRSMHMLNSCMRVYGPCSDGTAASMQEDAFTPTAAVDDDEGRHIVLHREGVVENARACIRTEKGKENAPRVKKEGGEAGGRTRNRVLGRRTALCVPPITVRGRALFSLQYA